jgi:hypothetical protein
MSHLALQRVIVRMLYDRRFCESVYADPAGATADCDLDDDERAWLVEPDPRAYRTDPMRRSRSLAGLLEEYPVAGALRVRSESDPGVLDPFFSSDLFHHTLQSGTSLAAAFGEWLQTGSDRPWSRSVAGLERTMAAARRDAGSGVERSSPGGLRLASGVRVHALPSGGLERYGHQLARLREHPRGVVEAVVDLGWTLPPSLGLGGATTAPPSSPGGDEAVLVDARAAELRLEPLSVELGAVLRLLESPQSFDDFVRAAAALGAEEEDCRGILEDFAGDGIVVAEPPVST